MWLQLDFDGGGSGSYGWLLRRGSSVIRSGYGVLSERATSNTAEWAGLVHGLEAASELGATALEIQGDSTLVLNQLCGRWGVWAPHLQPYYREAVGILRRLGCQWAVKWIPRERNEEADGLARQALPGRRGGYERLLARDDPEVVAA